MKNIITTLIFSVLLSACSLISDKVKQADSVAHEADVKMHKVDTTIHEVISTKKTENN